MDLLPVQCKVVDAESGAALLDKAKEAKATLTSVKTAKDKSIEACSFYFLDASVLRREGATPIHRQCYQKIDESLISEREISMDKVITRAYVDEILIVSHRWEERGTPDPDGTQELEIRKFLKSNPQFKYVWHDFWCLPQQPRSWPEQEAFERMLHGVNLVYLAATVLVLLDDQYAERFWTSGTSRADSCDKDAAQRLL